jgi:hypothetical protein
MTFPANPYERSPKGHHDRRLALGVDADKFAATAGITVDELKHYEFADAQDTSDPVVAQKVGRALARLEASVEPKAGNGPAPRDDDIHVRVYARLQSPELGQRLALADIESAQQVIAAELTAVDPTLQLLTLGERARGPMRELLLEWSQGNGARNDEVIVLPMQS